MPELSDSVAEPDSATGASRPRYRVQQVAATGGRGKGCTMSTGARFLVGVVVALALIGVISLLGSMSGFWKLILGVVVAAVVAAALKVAYPGQDG